MPVLVCQSELAIHVPPDSQDRHRFGPHPGLGTMGMSFSYATAHNEQNNLAVLRAAWEKGCRLWDTADMYGDHFMGENEQLLSKAFHSGIPRKDIFLCSKFGNWRNYETGERKVLGTPEYVKSAIEKTLKNLDVEYVDLYYQHRVDKNTPIEDTVQALKELQSAGKIRYIGLSECSASTLRRAYAVAPIAAVQVEYSLWETSIERSGLLDACKELGVARVASRKDLEGDSRLGHPRFSEENFPKNLKLVDELNNLAKKKECTASQLAIAWVHAQWEGVIAIPGTTRLAGLEENIASNDVKFTEAELKEIRTILDSFKTAGDRYPAPQMAALDH
ncbi:Aldo/keto reductase [Dacryopinax primogenitus]|uniref:Aldo/keto reductase n=1 Tax=Dacryopinax primogenitus (strain DJM 731) TaxID=1858805 RepID=M5G2K1_DACPD|nr:Aldo/keto reductase [Dacryopinax primogenitus]EJU04451.1 Aldo/keto reductase [Dacryopinax primogenitus]